MQVNSIKKSVFLSLVLCLALIPFAEAQPVDPGGDADVPITGIEWLLTAGALLGVKRLTRKKKE